MKMGGIYSTKVPFLMQYFWVVLFQYGLKFKKIYYNIKLNGLF